MKKKFVFWIAAIALLVGTGIFLFGRQGFFYPWNELLHKNEEIAEKTVIIDSLRKEIERLTSDTGYIEHVAREKLGMAKPDERVYKFMEKGK